MHHAETAGSARSPGEHESTDGRAGGDAAAVPHHDPLDSIREACQIFSPDWRVLYLNRAARRVYADAGTDPERMIGGDFWDEPCPERRDRAAAGQMRRAMAERVPVDFEHHWASRDRWYAFRLDPLPDGGLACFFRDVTAQKRSEESQRRLQRERDAALARLRLQFERVPLACIVFDAEHRIVDWNPAAEAIFGHRREEALGQDGPTLLLPGGARPPLDGILHRLAAGDMAAHSVNENVTRDGGIIVCEWHNTPLRGADGEVVALLSMVQDITERVRSDEALRASERTLAAELAAMARRQEVSTRLVGAEGGTPLLEEIVDAAITITGAERGVIQLLDPDGVGLTLVASRGFDAAFRERFRHLRGVRTASTEAARTGERVVVEDVARAAGVRAVQSTPLITRSGRLVGVLSTHYRERGRPAERHLRVVDLLARQAADWIERTQAEEAVRESEERYRALVSQVRDYAIFSTDARGVITTWNEGCQHVLGYARDEFVGLDLAALFTPEDRADGVPRRYRRRIAGGHAVQDERWMVAGGGRRFFAMGVATALRDAAGRSLGASVVLRDVTRMKLARDALADRGDRLERLVSERTDALDRANERLRASERMASLGTLAAGLGHDLGNLLLPLEARLQLLERAALPAELREHVVGIASCVAYLQRLSGGLRLLAADPADTRLAEPTELGTWWADVGRLLQNVLPRGVAFESRMPATESWVAMGRTGLTQAVFNVVQNAADALRGRAAGRVGVHVEPGPRPSTVAIDVTDDGPGMTADVLRRCTEPYFSTKPRGDSTGLGLALVRGLATAAGGELTIASTPGAGTAVRLVLPGAILPERRAP
ncbi:PAS domain S-box protein [Roseisolibacter sp. H3M3-2]|uniref:PAS domain S-box protein n=1 Tax=Roseisolibacter sp. H3M3-2 TaxID=3031323 RepID=UPI0023D982D6|nr:PAS domain S-box protein [Roseisolibacter sp. H3M3-2]MDF1502418.1 PAS domain S-box protein [Roseisolibacter sp. H3M3-2]